MLAEAAHYGKTAYLPFSLVELQIDSFKKCSGAAIAVPFSSPLGKRVGTTIVDPLQSRLVKKFI
jgi:hypothetical protein